jgi:antitoxin FitA
MQNACEHEEHMTTMIQIRNVPEQVHRTLKARAAMAGMSLSGYVLRELEILALEPSRAEVFERLESLEPVELSVSVAALLREERESR